MWHFDKSPVQKEKNSFMLAVVEGHGMCRIELGESQEQWKERDDRDWCHGDCGLTWLVNGHPEANAEVGMIAWAEIFHPDSIAQNRRISEAIRKNLPLDDEDRQVLINHIENYSVSKDIKAP